MTCTIDDFKTFYDGFKSVDYDPITEFFWHHNGDRYLLSTDNGTTWNFCDDKDKIAEFESNPRHSLLRDTDKLLIDIERLGRNNG
jgi:hypothetical protein